MRWADAMQKVLEIPVPRRPPSAVSGKAIVGSWGSGETRAMSIFPADVANSNATPVTDPIIRQQVEDLLIDYVHAVDDFELDRWPNFFTEDGIYQIIPRESYDQNLPLGIMFCDGRGMMVDRILALETANIFEPHTNSHIIGRPKLSLNDDDTINARSNFNITRTMQDGRMEIYATGKYIDVITLAGDKPLFQDRRVVLESRRVDILLVYPL